MTGNNVVTGKEIYLLADFFANCKTRAASRKSQAAGCKLQELGRILRVRRANGEARKGIFLLPQAVALSGFFRQNQGKDAVEYT